MVISPTTTSPTIASPTILPPTIATPTSIYPTTPYTTVISPTVSYPTTLAATVSYPIVTSPTVRYPTTAIAATILPATVIPTNYSYVFCGDGVVQKERGEKCDAGYDKNGKTASNCSVTCQTIFVPTCGNGTVDAGEECDDGNTRDLDACTNQCKARTSARCGDSRLNIGAGEQCDEGVKNGTADSFCTADCKKKAAQQCGDGQLDSTKEECDNGVLNGNYPESTCLSNCLLPYCGDGVIGLSEQCDDGNQFDFDGCDHTCLSEITQTAADQMNDGLTGKNGGYLGGNIVGKNGYTSDGRYYGNIPTPAKTPTGPGLVIFLASGAAAGVGLARRRFLK